MSAKQNSIISPIYSKKRYLSFFIISLFAIIAPFITIDGKHLFLLSFVNNELHLFFTSFSTQELYLMPFLLIALFLSIFFMTTLGGRIWCGWACPQTIFRVIFRDFIETKLLKIRTTIANKQNKRRGQFFKKVLAMLIWIILSLFIASNFIWYFVPPKDFFLYIQNPTEHAFLIGLIFCIAAFIFADIVFIKENFCIYVCPYARVQSVMFDNDTIQVIYDEKRGGIIYDKNHNKLGKKPLGKEDECIGCEACVRICPTHIDIRRGMQLECINCLECSDACAKIMGKFNKKSLINWTSENSIKTRSKINFMRFRTISYAIALMIVVFGLGFMGLNKKSMLLNINRDSNLYNIKVEDDIIKVENDYIFLIENIDSVEHDFYFDVSNKDIKIKKPNKSIKIKGGKKEKVIVTLYTTKRLINDGSSDEIHNITIKAFAKDDKEKINTQKDIIFIYPRDLVIQSKLK